MSVFFLLLTLCACSDLSLQRRLLMGGVGNDIDPGDVKSYVAQQDSYLSQFVLAAGLTAPAGGALAPADWVEVTKAGVTYITRECGVYVDSIFEVNRAKTFTDTELAALGTTTATIMGLAKAKAKAIATVAAAFGIAIITEDNMFNTVLYKLEPSSVNKVITVTQDAVRKKISTATIITRTDAVAALHEYLRTCVPANIEYAVNDSLKSTTVSSSPGAAPPAPVPAPPAPVAPGGPTGSPALQPHQLFFNGQS